MPSSSSYQRRNDVLLLLLLMILSCLAAVQGFFVLPPRHRLPQHQQTTPRGRQLFASTTQEPEITTSDEADAAIPTSSSSSSSSSGKGFGAAPPPSTNNGPRAKTGTVNKRLLNVIDAELKVVRDNQPEEARELTEEDTDLNGINPIQPLGAAVFAGFISFLFWRITMGLATTLNGVHLDTDFYPAKRIFGIASTAFVGITALGAGVIGVTAVGLLGLTMRVAIGVATGELDMNKKKAVPVENKSAIPLDAQGLPKLMGAWYDVKPTPPSQSPPEGKEGQK